METVKNTGVWIDSKEAIIVKLNNGKEVMEKVFSEIEGRERFDGEGKHFTRMGNKYSTFEKRDEEKRKHAFTQYFKNVIEKIKDSDNILVFGPAEAKIGLQKEILKKKDISSKLLMVEAEDHLTDNQVTAKVRKFFSKEKIKH